MITKADLKSIDSRTHFLYCDSCGCQCSADYSDYFEMDNTSVFYCPEGCEEIEEDYSEDPPYVPYPMVIATRQSPRIVKR